MLLVSGEILGDDQLGLDVEDVAVLGAQQMVLGPRDLV